MKRLLGLSLVLSIVAGGQAGAAVVNIDFQSSGEVMSGSSGAVIPFPGSYWNTNGRNGTAMPLLTSTEAPSGVELVPNLRPATTTEEGDALYRDYVYGNATIRGLNADRDYHIVIYSAANLQGIFRVAQPFDTNSPGYGEVACKYEYTVLPGFEGCDYVHGMATADAAGEIDVRVHPGAMAGMQIDLNPEPSVMLLNLIAAFGAILRRRR